MSYFNICCLPGNSEVDGWEETNADELPVLSTQAVCTQYQRYHE